MIEHVPARDRLATIGQQNVEMRMPAQELAGSLDEADRAGGEHFTAEPGRNRFGTVKTT